MDVNSVWGFEKFYAYVVFPYQLDPVFKLSGILLTLALLQGVPIKDLEYVERHLIGK
jgi:hypothetical protein